jgi:hypothetical protein
VAVRKVEDGWRIDHDHISSWIPKEDWLREFAGEEGKDWYSISGIFDHSGRGLEDDLIAPLHWIIKDEKVALMFALIWEHK